MNSHEAEQQIAKIKEREAGLDLATVAIVTLAGVALTVMGVALTLAVVYV